MIVIKGKEKELWEILVNLSQQSHSINSNSNVHKGELIVLKAINESNGSSPNSPGVKPSELSKIINISPPAISQIINSLEEKELIIRKTTKDDRRIVYVTQTQKGEAIIKSYIEEKIEFFKRIVETLGEVDTDNLICLLSKLSSAFDTIKKESNL